MTDPHTEGADAVIEDNALKPGQFFRCRVGSEDVLLCRASAGGIYAVRNRCSHMDKPLHEGRLIGHRISCPEHGAEFDVRTGEALSFPAVRPLVRFDVLVRDGQIMVSRDPAPAPAVRSGPRFS